MAEKILGWIMDYPLNMPMQALLRSPQFVTDELQARRIVHGTKQHYGPCTATPVVQATETEVIK